MVHSNKSYYIVKDTGTPFPVQSEFTSFGLHDSYDTHFIAAAAYIASYM